MSDHDAETAKRILELADKEGFEVTEAVSREMFLAYAPTVAEPTSAFHARAAVRGMRDAPAPPWRPVSSRTQVPAAVYVPGRPAVLATWKLIWTEIEDLVRNGANYAAIDAHLAKHKSNFGRGRKTMSKIIVAGLAGRLD
jgi:hypothetical protein